MTTLSNGYSCQTFDPSQNSKPLYSKHAHQFSPQPAWVEVDFEAKTVTAGFDTQIGGYGSERLNKGIVRRVPVSEQVDAVQINRLFASSSFIDKLDEVHALFDQNAGRGDAAASSLDEAWGEFKEFVSDFFEASESDMTCYPAHEVVESYEYVHEKFMRHAPLTMAEMVQAILRDERENGVVVEGDVAANIITVVEAELQNAEDEGSLPLGLLNICKLSSAT